MNPRERTLATLRGKEVDRVPLMLDGFEFASPIEDGPSDKKAILDRIGDQVPFFSSFNSAVNRYLVTPPQRMNTVSEDKDSAGNLTTTVEIDTPKGPLTAITGRNVASNTMWTIKYPVESLEDIEKIRSVPWEMPPAVVAPDVSSLPPSFAERGITRTGVSSPFVCVAGMMPYEYFLELCLTDLDLMKELTQQCLDRILDVLSVLLSAKNIEYVWMGGCEWLTPPMGSPEMYRELVHEFERQVIEKIHEAGAISHIHCHGNVRSTLELAIQRRGDFFEPMEPPPDGDITLAEAKSIANGRITLGGNIEARILEKEDANAVEEATRAAFEGGKNRMILSTSAGPLSEMTPQITENYHRLIDVWEELSPI